MPSEADLAAAQRLIIAGISERTQASLAQVWLGMTSWSKDAAEEMLAQVVPIVMGGQRATAAATAAYLSQATGTPVTLDMDSLVGAAVRNGVDPMDVYMRAVKEARIAYSQSDMVDLAVNVGMRQLLGSADTDLQLTANHAAQQALGQAGVKVYRRVTRPGACGLCVAASDRVYTVGDLMPMHAHCHCQVLPGSKLPKELQRGAGEDPTNGRGLVIDDNDEIGPVLDYADRVKNIRRGKRTYKHRSERTDAEILAQKKAQLAGYDKVFANGGGNQWLAVKADRLRAEIAELEARIVPTPVTPEPVVPEVVAPAPASAMREDTHKTTAD